MDTAGPKAPVQARRIGFGVRAGFTSALFAPCGRYLSQHFAAVWEINIREGFQMSDKRNRRELLFPDSQITIQDLLNDSIPQEESVRADRKPQASRKQKPRTTRKIIHVDFSKK